MSRLCSLLLTFPLPLHPEPITAGFFPLTHKPLTVALSGHQGHFRSQLLLLYLPPVFHAGLCGYIPPGFPLSPLAGLSSSPLLVPHLLKLLREYSGYHISSLFTPHFKYHLCNEDV